MKSITTLLSFIILCSCAHKRNKTVIAHRGASGYLPEHTLPAAAMAHGFNVNYIEADLVMTKDDHLVVLHDIHIDTTTNVSKVYPMRARKDKRFYAVDFTLKELKRLKVNERKNLKTQKRVFGNRFPLNHSSFEIASFEEFIELVQGMNRSRKTDIGIYPELKSPEFHSKEGKDIVKITYDILNKYGYNRKDANIFVQCFYPESLQRLKFEYKAKFRLVQLIAENEWNESSIDYDKLLTQEGLKKIATYADGIGPYLKQLISKEEKKSGAQKIVPNQITQWAHDYRLVVHPYTHRSDTLNKPFDTDKLFFDFLYEELKVDGIFSDFGDIAVMHSH